MGKKQGVGRALMKKSRPPVSSERHSSVQNDDISRVPSRSITEETSLSEFFHIAKLANADFTAQKKSFRIVSKDELSGVVALGPAAKVQTTQNKHMELLKVPRRPPWNREMSADELHKLENEEFLKWRRSLAELEAKDGVLLTPFEKNIEFWRQLWHVVERSDVLVQIVDARQPLLYYCADLERYAHEVDANKVCLLLVNKSDLLTSKQRLLWHNYFKSQSVHALFWSAAAADRTSVKQICEENQTASQVETAIDSTINSPNSASDSDGAESDSTIKSGGTCPEEPALSSEREDTNPTENTCPVPTENQEVVDDPARATTDDHDARLLSVTELLDYFAQIYPADRPRLQPSYLTVGFVGYPNVGKSSTLNALLGSKKTSVSATPGRTKHFQTLFARPDLVLCDCPGLVMPSFVHSKADLVVASILSVDEMRDFLTPIGLVCQRIPRPVLEFKYGITLSRPKLDSTATTDEEMPPTPHELLAAHALSRSFMTAKGNPHYDRSARIILKDYVQGRLLYCHPPPGVDAHEFQRLGHEADLVDPSLSHAEINKSRESRPHHTKKPDGSDLITEFDRLAFNKKPVPRSHVRSQRTLLPFRPADPSVVDDGASISSSSSWTTVDSSVGGSSLLLGTDRTSFASVSGDIKRPWRVLSHSKRGEFIDGGKPGPTFKRREKLRRVYKHLDQHETT